MITLYSKKKKKKNLPVVYMLMSLCENLITRQQKLCEIFLCHHFVIALVYIL